jgi:serine protease Do
MPDPPMPIAPRNVRVGLRLFALLTAGFSLAFPASASADDDPRMSHRLTPIVRAVRDAAESVVNIQGQKAVSGEGVGGVASRQVNGMGTGVVIDPRGYILTNFHVVDGVRQINVTLADGNRLVAQNVAHDRETDLAVIRIRTSKSLPVVRLGTSSDLMTGETVVAMGNAFGYEHTVTTGIISALHRNVQVNETQQYLDLIQTDASINPGNSGGPLLNIDGEMIGVNVAVRAGAQGIGFAIPVDKALDVASRLMSIQRLENHWHGMMPLASEGPQGPVTIGKVEPGSPALESGLRSGDQLESIGSVAIRRPIDVERALLGRRAGEPVPVRVRREGQTWETELSVASLSRRSSAMASFATKPVSTPTRSESSSPELDGLASQTWNMLGMLLEPEPKGTFVDRGLAFEGGLRVTKVRPGSSAAEQGVVVGDLLVKVHRYYTTSEQDLRYLINRADSIFQLGDVRFDIVRGQDRFFGHLAMGAQRRSGSTPVGVLVVSGRRRGEA